MRKRSILCSALLVYLSFGAFAGFLSGNSTVNLENAGQFGFKTNATILRTGTPFSSICLAGKYGYNDNLDLYAKYGIGTIDYTTIDVKLSSDPQISTAGFDYMLSGSRKEQYTSIAFEYETASWSINKKSNISSEIMMGYDYSYLSDASTRTRLRVGLHNFNSGVESEEDIATSVKYSLSTEIEHIFPTGIRGTFEGGIFFGDLRGVISYFGLGLGFNT